MKKQELLEQLEKSTRKNYGTKKFDIDTVVFYASYQEMRHESMANPEKDDFSYHFSEDEAVKAAECINVEVGFTSIVSRITIDADYLDNIELDEDLELSDLMDYNRFNFDIEDLYDIYTNEGDDVEGYIIIGWNYETYVGYARNFEYIRYGERKETEASLYTGNEERTFRNNESILLTADEIKGFSDLEILQVVQDEIYKSHWKWNYFKNRPTDEKIIDGLGLEID